ncbi:hypothetical protein Bca4012_019507 [Brassica carinata]|uniref:NAC domain-containing protein n=1 Tax=Brassica carinata TaxID=52824 RepID=A0A8X7WK66_BRACI|nr:hypothetical protein Bca52824_002097 [Brassica carinata]
MTLKRTRGSHFNPTNFELLNILQGRIVRNKRCSFITDMQNLYEREPWLLQHVRHVRFYENEWLYFVRRNKRPGMKKADSKRPSRKVGESGIWKTTGTVIQIKNQDGVNLGSMRHISFKANSETVKDGITTGWTMHEFVLDKPWFQDVVLCRIRFYKRKENAQYAPRFLPIVIGREQGETIHLGVAAAGEELQHVDAPVETHEAEGIEQLTGSCSREVVSYLASQQIIMAQDSNYPILNGGMMQHEDFGSYGQHHNHIIGQMETSGQGSGDMIEYQNQYLGQETTDTRQVPVMMNQALNEWNGYSGSSLAHQYLGKDMAAQGQHFSVNGSMEKHQGFGSYGQLSGELLGQQQGHILGRQATCVSLMEDHQKQSQNLFGGHGTDPSHSAQAMEEAQQQWNGYFGPYSAQPYNQGVLEQQDFGSSALGLAQNHQYFGQNNDSSALSEPAAQQQHLGEGSNLSLIQHQNQILGQATLLSPMEQLFRQGTDPSQVPAMMNQALEEQHYVPWSAQPNDQYKGQNSPTVPVKTQQQQDSFVRNSPAQLQPEAQDNVPLRNQTIEAQTTDLPMDQGVDEPDRGIVGSPTYNELYQEFLGEEEMDSEMDNIWTDFLNEEWVQKLGKNTPEEEAELMADLTNCETFESFFDSLLSN